MLYVTNNWMFVAETSHDDFKLDNLIIVLYFSNASKEGTNKLLNLPYNLQFTICLKLSISNR